MLRISYGLEWVHQRTRTADHILKLGNDRHFFCNWPTIFLWHSWALLWVVMRSYFISCRLCHLHVVKNNKRACKALIITDWSPYAIMGSKLKITNCHTKSRFGSYWGGTPTFFRIIPLHLITWANKLESFQTWGHKGLQSALASYMMQSNNALVAMAMTIFIWQNRTRMRHNVQSLVWCLAFIVNWLRMGHKFFLLGKWVFLFGSTFIISHISYKVSIYILDRVAIKYILGNRIGVKDTIIPWPCYHPPL